MAPVFDWGWLRPAGGMYSTARDLGKVSDVFIRLSRDLGKVSDVFIRLSRDLGKVSDVFITARDLGKVSDVFIRFSDVKNFNSLREHRRVLEKDIVA